MSSKTEPAAATTPTTATANKADADTPGEAALLVSEFPPPPSYYKQAAKLQPPAIPTDALTLGTQRAAAAASKARAEAERLRLGQQEDTDAILGGTKEEEEGNVVSAYGEIVEDPYLVEPLDSCQDPTKIRDSVQQLNRQVVQGFVGLVKDLVHNPTENKQRRDELSHQVFLMLQECNKFREHQAREVLIDLLERQLDKRKQVLAKLQTEIETAKEILGE